MKFSVHGLAALFSLALATAFLLAGPLVDPMHGTVSATAYLPSVHLQSAHLQTDDVFPAADWAVAGGPSDSLGEFMSGIGDVNGDGFADFAVGGAGEFQVFLGAEDGPAAEADFSSSNLGPSGLFYATTVAGVGDVNGDGFADLGAGAAYDADSTGVVRIYYGNESGFSRSDTWEMMGGQVDEIFGGVVAGAGDVNGDGYADVLISAPGSYDATFPGVVYLFYGGEDGLAATPATTLTNEQSDDTQDGDNFGDVASSAGDVNGDGFGDVLVRNPAASAVYLYLGAADGLVTTPAAELLPEEYDYIFADALYGLGDVNGDGFDDVMVDAINIDESIKAYVYHGSADGLGDAPTTRLVVDSTLLDQVGDMDGAARAVGDLDGDGYSDLAIAAVWPAYLEEGSGTVFFYRGSAEGLAETPYAALYGTSDGDTFGSVLAGVGDVNGDQMADLLVGAPDSTEGGAYAGKAYLFLTASTWEMSAPPATAAAGDWTPGAQITLEGEPTEAYGWPALIVRDMNGDGFDELVINSVGDVDAQVAGHVELYWGGAEGIGTEPDWRISAKQWQTTKSAAASLLGKNDDTSTSFYVADLGDLNGDGLSDLGLTVVDFVAESSQVLVYAGSTEEIATEPTWQVSTPVTGTLNGFKLYGAGDVNGDGFDDLAMLNFNDSENALYFTLHTGGEDGPAAEPAWTFSDLWPFNDITVSFTGLGDINQDGYDDVLIGSPGAPEGDANGEILLFTGSADGLTAEPVWSQVGASDEGHLGLSVAALGDVDGNGADDFAVSEFGHNNEQGRVHIFWADAQESETMTSVTLESDRKNFVFGVLTAAAGDVNSDGFADLFVGSIDTSSSETLVWQLFFGSANGIVPTPVFEEEMPFGSESVAFFQQVGTGDLNGDGFGDFSLSYFHEDYFGMDEMEAAKAVITFGAEGEIPAGLPTVWPPLPSMTLSIAPTVDSNDLYGWPALIVGDVNGDGYDDLAVNTFGDPDGGMAQVQIHHGAQAGVGTVPDWQMSSDQWPALADEGMATSFTMGALGDVNGDGYDDLAITLINFQVDASRVLVYHGGAEGLETEVAWAIQPLHEGEITGVRIASAGDVDGDGYADLLLVKLDEPNNLVDLALYAGGADGLAEEASWTLTGVEAYQDLFMGAAGLGDINEDGFDDLLIGQPYVGQDEAVGAIELWLGSADGLATVGDWRQEGTHAEANLGATTVKLGDVDGDGWTDFAASEPGYNDEQGQVHLYFPRAADMAEYATQNLEGTLDNGIFGLLLVGPGDVNGDGYAELLIGSLDRADDTLVWQLYAGSADGVGVAPIFEQRVPIADELFLFLNIMMPGDLNGDGYNDLVFPAVDMNAQSDGAAFTGNVVIYYGAPTE